MVGVVVPRVGCVAVAVAGTGRRKRLIGCDRLRLWLGTACILVRSNNMLTVRHLHLLLLSSQLLVRRERVIERTEISLDRAVQLVLADLLVGRIVLKAFSWLLAASTCLQRRLFQQKLLQVVCGVKVGLVRRGDKNGLNLLALQCNKIDRGKKLVLGEALPGVTKTLIRIRVEGVADGVKTRQANGW